MSPLLEIKNLHAGIAETPILKGFSLSVNPGEVHAIMGPNGAGKSTLSYILAGREDYHIDSGQALLDGKDLLAMSPEERAWAGVFLAFQYPIEIPGVTNMTFLKTALNAIRKGQGQDELDAASFLRLVREKSKSLGMSDDMLKRELNVGFSGGEKKRNEILQMALLEPRLAILDETDSGLDVDALRVVGEGVTALRSENRSFVVITHYQRLLDYIQPDFVHVMANGRLIETGTADLARDLERTGYKDYVERAHA